MSLIDRAKNILLAPKVEWPIIAAEPATVGGLYTGYAAILALLPLVCGILGGVLVLTITGGAMMLPLILVSPILGYVIGLALLYVIGLIINAVAPSFGGVGNLTQTMKLVIYASTASWIGGALGALIPFIGFLFSIAGTVYAIYLFYLGSGPVLSVPQDKQVAFTAVSALIWIGISLVAMFIVGAIVAAMVMTTAGVAGAYGG